MDGEEKKDKYTYIEIVLSLKKITRTPEMDNYRQEVSCTRGHISRSFVMPLSLIFSLSLNSLLALVRPYGHFVLFTFLVERGVCTESCWTNKRVR